MSILFEDDKEENKKFICWFWLVEIEKVKYSMTYV